MATARANASPRGSMPKTVSRRPASSGEIVAALQSTIPAAAKITAAIRALAISTGWIIVGGPCANGNSTASNTFVDVCSRKILDKMRRFFERRPKAIDEQNCYVLRTYSHPRTGCHRRGGWGGRFRCDPEIGRENDPRPRGTSRGELRYTAQDPRRSDRVDHYRGAAFERGGARRCPGGTDRGSGF